MSEKPKNKKKGNYRGGGGGKKQQQETKQPKTFRALWDMNDEEKQLQDEKMELLNQKYRDRAKERRQGQFDLRQDGRVYANVSDSGEDEEDRIIKVKGLDYDLLREQDEKHVQDDEQKKQNQEKLAQIKSNVFSLKEKAANIKKQKQLKEPGKLAKSIRKVLENGKTYQIGLFPKPFTYYKYELGENSFSNTNLPTMITKQRHQDQVQTFLAYVSEECSDKINRIMKILKTGGRQKLREEREKNQMILKQKQESQINEESEDSEDDIFQDAKVEKKKSKQKPLKLLQDGEKMFEEEMTAEEARKQIQEFGQNPDKKKSMEESFQKPSKLEKKESSTSGTESKNEKRKRNFMDEQDYYEECFQNSAPSLQMLKKMKVDGLYQVQDKQQKKQKKENFDQQYQKIQKILDNKKSG